MSAFKEEKTYTETYQEGDIQPIDEFLTENGVDPRQFKNTKDKMLFAEKDQQLCVLLL